MIYSVVLLNQDGEHLATEPLDAEDHCKAQSAAVLILELCKDIGYSYEVRFNGAVFASGYRRGGQFDPSPFIEPPPIYILEVVERLEHGFTAVALRPTPAQDRSTASTVWEDLVTDVELMGGSR
jgi:hypothetical protein